MGALSGLPADRVPPGIEELAGKAALLRYFLSENHRGGVRHRIRRIRRKFIAKHDLGVTLLSDPDHAVMEKYDAWGEKKLYGRLTQGVKRSTVLIDPAGKVAHHWTNVRAKGHAAKVAERLAELAG